ncbi:MAG: arylesterase [Pseudomonadota bacterium]
MKQIRYLMMLFLALLSFLGSASFASAAAPVVLVLGDSLSAAYGLSEKAGWVNLLREKLAARNPSYDVVNASISGDTTRGGLSRLDAALKQHKPQIVIIELGGNDALRGLSLRTMRSNLDSIVNAVQQAHAKPLIVGVEMPPNYGPVYTKQFAQVFQDIAQKYNIPLVPSIFAGFSNKYDHFQSDGIHPVATAQPIMLETIWKGLVPLLEDVPGKSVLLLKHPNS